MTAPLPMFLAALLAPSGGLAADKVTFADHVLPIFEQSCLNCHNPDKNKGGLDLSSYTAAMRGGSGGKIAEPGDGGGSSLFASITHTGENKMPPKGDKIPKAQADTIRAWIDGGLLETKSLQLLGNAFQGLLSCSPTLLSEIANELFHRFLVDTTATVGKHRPNSITGIHGKCVLPITVPITVPRISILLALT